MNENQVTKKKEDSLVRSFYEFKYEDLQLSDESYVIKKNVSNIFHNYSKSTESLNFIYFFSRNDYFIEISNSFCECTRVINKLVVKKVFDFLPVFNDEIQFKNMLGVTINLIGGNFNLNLKINVISFWSSLFVFYYNISRLDEHKDGMKKNGIFVENMNKLKSELSEFIVCLNVNLLSGIANIMIPTLVLLKNIIYCYREDCIKAINEFVGLDYILHYCKGLYLPIPGEEGYIIAYECEIDEPEMICETMRSALNLLDALFKVDKTAKVDDLGDLLMSCRNDKHTEKTFFKFLCTFAKNGNREVIEEFIVHIYSKLDINNDDLHSLSCVLYFIDTFVYENNGFEYSSKLIDILLKVFEKFGIGGNTHDTETSNIVPNRSEYNSKSFTDICVVILNILSNLVILGSFDTKQKNAPRLYDFEFSNVNQNISRMTQMNSPSKYSSDDSVFIKQLADNIVDVLKQLYDLFDPPNYPKKIGISLVSFTSVFLKNVPYINADNSISLYEEALKVECIEFIDDKDIVIAFIHVSANILKILENEKPSDKVKSLKDDICNKFINRVRNNNDKDIQKSLSIFEDECIVDNDPFEF